jgi:hypothetical protein
MTPSGGLSAALTLAVRLPGQLGKRFVIGRAAKSALRCRCRERVSQRSEHSQRQGHQRRRPLRSTKALQPGSGHQRGWWHRVDRSAWVNHPYYRESRVEPGLVTSPARCQAQAGHFTSLVSARVGHFTNPGAETFPCSRTSHVHRVPARRCWHRRSSTPVPAPWEEQSPVSHLLLRHICRVEPSYSTEFLLL